MVNGSWIKKNGLIQRERPPGRESPVEDKVRASLRPNTAVCAAALTEETCGLCC